MIEYTYEDTDKSLNDVLDEVIKERFPSYTNIAIKTIFCNKRRVKKGKICLASIELTNPKTRFLTIDDFNYEGYDYIMIVDRKAWQVASDKDKKRLLSHELRHIFIDEKGKYKIIDHDITDFVREVELNKDDPDWSNNLSILVSDIYDQEKEKDTA